jgi:co-chaperonin GroES (HSP10)
METNSDLEKPNTKQVTFKENGKTYYEKYIVPSFTPYSKYFMVIPFSEPTTNKFGLITTVKEPVSTLGLIVSKGNECTNIEIGQVVVFGRGCGKQLTLEGQKVILLADIDAYGVYTRYPEIE